MHAHIDLKLKFQVLRPNSVKNVLFIKMANKKWSQVRRKMYTD